ncbi:uncharacterized protein CHSO_0162 [Chryseobacterium sp. StRB126]|uniref:hypothetical protein n=1 Tax=Chryseobacterium sp. StRB126 TaxID=878220 RepID=UPI0004E99F1C|nr:hypothetical protein [Chryseobacterium sp. StRB126]BAP29199.1 uncharacterized protein CHSO_0162 [Chryseobacterium sp. StRB126]
MKYFIWIFFFLLLNCKQEKNKIKDDEIIKIIYENNQIVNNITDNFYILDNRFKEPGKHNLMMTSQEINIIKKKIIKEEIFKLDDSLTFVELCKRGCLSEITIVYKSGRKQHFIFDNYNYQSNFSSDSYRRIISLEELIAQIMMKKKFDPEPINVHF